MTSKAKNGAYKILAAQKSTFTKIAGVITPEAIDNLENEIGGIFTILKSIHFDKGQHYGYLACVIPEDKYRVVIANNTWAYQAPDNPGAYAVTALGAGVSAAQQDQIVANHKEAQHSYAEYLGAQEAGKELILYGVGDNALAPLKKQYNDFGDATIHKVIKHLREKTAIKMTTSQKYDYKTEGYKKPWDPTMSITAYFTGLDKFQISLADRSIVCISKSVEEKAMFHHMVHDLEWEGDDGLENLWGLYYIFPDAQFMQSYNSHSTTKECMVLDAHPISDDATTAATTFSSSMTSLTTGTSNSSSTDALIEYNQDFQNALGKHRDDILCLIRKSATHGKPAIHTKMIGKIC
jgi:hypothetical protein